ncbi:MAG: leucine-rich repeat domain-containing protein, partial [Porphyromonadaceae bacterium]|nr:leucine-rich repeat domain-containing protein [Porphyromonadaceae bacterium]
MSIANETAGKLQEKISDKQIQFVKDLTITGILNREDMDYVYSSKSIEKLHLGQAVLKQDTLWSPSKQDSDIPLPNLKEIDLPQTLKAIGASALSQKSQLIRISGTDSLEYIGVSALANDSLLRAFSFGNRLQKIDSLAFMGCKSLVDISFPDSLSWLGAKAFKGCSSITHLTIP